MHVVNERTMRDLLAQTVALFVARGVPATVLGQSALRWYLAGGHGRTPLTPLEVVDMSFGIRPASEFVRVVRL